MGRLRQRRPGTDPSVDCGRACDCGHQHMVSSHIPSIPKVVFRGFLTSRGFSVSIGMLAHIVNG